MKYIKIRGARQHNLKNINLDIPKNKLVVFTGVSGSGKSSLAFDTIYAEGQRRYIESLSTYARQFLGVMDKPDVDHIEGLSPSISIDQKSVSKNPRSTVGTSTEIYDYLRLLFAKIGHPHCPVCSREISSQSIEQIIDGIINLIKQSINNQKVVRFLILSPVVRDKKGEFSSLMDNLKAKGFATLRIDKQIRNVDEDLYLIKTNKHTIEVVTDKLSFSKNDFKNKTFFNNLVSRLSASVEQALKLADGLVLLTFVKDQALEFPKYPKIFEDHIFSEKFACPVDNIQIEDIEPRLFSFNSPHGACSKCLGIGSILKADPDLIFSKELSITEGGILPFMNMFEHDTWYSRLILQVCQTHNIDPKTAIKNLSRTQLSIILNGTGSKTYKVPGTNKRGQMTSIYETFNGVLNDIEKRFENTTSEMVRDITKKFLFEIDCPQCLGKRLKPEALAITIDNKSIIDVSKLSINNLFSWISNLKYFKNISPKEKEISSMIITELTKRLEFLLSVGLDYITIDRKAGTLSGGESQRIRLASQIGSGLSGVLYILDEPTIGLHPVDNNRLIKSLKHLTDLDNTVIVVEHDRDMIKSSDYVIDFGPSAGKNGGEIVFNVPTNEIKNQNSLTAKYINNKKSVSINHTGSILTTKNQQRSLTFKGLNHNNLKNIDIEIPLGKLVCVTGVSGSGKSSLLVDTIYPLLYKHFNQHSRLQIGQYESVAGLEYVDKVILIDQSPIGRTPRSNPATYTKVFDEIRDIYALTRQSKVMGYKKGRFSFNVKGGRCEDCEGQGVKKIEMQFMSDIWITCEVCKGSRYNRQTLEIEYKGKNISDILKMNVSESIEFFHNHKKLLKKLEILKYVGLDYIELGQPATTLSGGEAQRIKLALELSKTDTGNTVYILDEPTTGLHFEDSNKLLNVLSSLVSRGNSVLLIEHNLDIVKNADWIIDLGPGGGDDGGKVIFQGSLKQIKNSPISKTGQFLKKLS